MTYELAKKLKDAGFPQKSVEHQPCGYYMNKESKNADSIEMIADFITEENKLCYVPTLSELIEEMPMRAKNLGTINDAHFQIWKLVTRNPKGDYRACMVDENNGNIVDGYNFVSEDGAEEAVANLWLALNKTKND